MPSSSPPRALSVLAALNALLHLLGLVLALVAIRPGSPLAAPADRVAYVAARPPLWAASWGVWGLCALALTAFLALAAARARRTGDEGRAALGALALALAAAGAGVDLLCDVLYIAVLPRIAAEGLVPLFLVAERALVAAGVVVANGLYSIAVALATVALRPLLARATAAAGYFAFGFGLLMAAGGLVDAPALVAFATGPTILAFVAWALLAARDLEGPVRARPAA